MAVYIRLDCFTVMRMKNLILSVIYRYRPPPTSASTSFFTPSAIMMITDIRFHVHFGRITSYEYLILSSLSSKQFEQEKLTRIIGLRMRYTKHPPIYCRQSIFCIHIRART